MYHLQSILSKLGNRDSRLFQTETRCVRTFYRKLLIDQSSTDPLFQMWKNETSFIYGDVNRALTQNSKINPSRLGERFGIEYEGRFDMSVLLMSIQTFYSLLIKFITFNIAQSVESENAVTVYSDGLIKGIMDGSSFRKFGILNYCYEDWYFWIIKYWDADIHTCCAATFNVLEEDNTIASRNAFVRLYRNDFLKNIYETIIPKEIRHALGEFYTPDWLAACAIRNAVSSSGNSLRSSRFLDPTCGSGTFLIKVIQLMRIESADDSIPDHCVFGYDINALAVLTAKTNYLIATMEQSTRKDKVFLPIFHYDIINTPYFTDQFFILDTGCNLNLKIPISFFNKISKSKEILTAQAFLELLQEDSASDPDIAKLKSGFDPLDHTNALILANIVLNRIFAFMEPRADIVVGNPPWVNWEYLPPDYKLKSQHLWPEYGLFDATGRDLSFSKEDISVLITYLVIDRFLADNGYLSFVLRQAMFKSAQNGVGFRKFNVKKEYPIRVLRVDDLSQVNPFDGTNSRSVLVLIKKNEQHTFPVLYYSWSKKKTFTQAVRDPLATADSILSCIEMTDMIAVPSVKDDPTSIWVTVPRSASKIVDKILGTNRYNARTGVFTGGANAVYWLHILNRNNDGSVTVSNIVNRAKRKVDAISAALEPTYIFPLVQGSNLKKWHVDYASYILCPHTAETKMRPVSEENLAKETPGTLRYLSSFKTELDARKGFAGWEKEIQNHFFYAILRVGKYTFSKYKVAWRYIAQSFTTAVISSVDDKYLGHKMLIPNEKIMYVSTNCEEEAYYLCGVLSSSLVCYCVKSYMNPTSISAHVLKKLHIPDFDANNPYHMRISEICKEGHHTADLKKRDELQKKLDLLVATLYDISEDQLNVILKLID